MLLKYLQRAVSIAEKSVEQGGGPFGAVIVKDGKVIAEASNSVTLDCDPSAHAEVNAIRAACRLLKTHDLSGAEIYTSCEPCPMCLGAIYWAHCSRIHFAATRSDAKAAGFDDDFIYGEFSKSPKSRSIPASHEDFPGANAPFERWKSKEDKKVY